MEPRIRERRTGFRRTSRSRCVGRLRGRRDLRKLDRTGNVGSRRRIRGKVRSGWSAWVDSTGWIDGCHVGERSVAWQLGSIHRRKCIWKSARRSWFWVLRCLYSEVLERRRLDVGRAIWNLRLRYWKAGVRRLGGDLCGRIDHGTFPADPGSGSGPAFVVRLQEQAQPNRAGSRLPTESTDPADLPLGVSPWNCRCVQARRSRGPTLK